jgi:hypothetical protein
LLAAPAARAFAQADTARRVANAAPIYTIVRRDDRRMSHPRPHVAVSVHLTRDAEWKDPLETDRWHIRR